MAGIEKICEFSGEHSAYAMYSYKRNHIQIIPKFRVKFRGADATLNIFKPTDILMYSFGSYERVMSNHKDSYNPPFNSTKDYINYRKKTHGMRHLKDYDFALCVSNEELMGRVGGVYINNTYDLKSTKRRLKRMLRCRKLNVVYHDCSLLDFIKNK